MLDFQKTVFIEKLQSAHDNTNFDSTQCILMCIPLHFNMQLISMLSN